MRLRRLNWWHPVRALCFGDHIDAPADRDWAHHVVGIFHKIIYLGLVQAKSRARVGFLVVVPGRVQSMQISSIRYSTTGALLGLNHRLARIEG